MSGGRRPGVVFAGVLVPVAVLAAVVAAFATGAFAGIGWRGGEYAYAFIGVALAGVVVGAVLGALPNARWRSFGFGLVLGGVLGVVGVIATVVLFLVAWSQAGP